MRAPGVAAALLAGAFPCDGGPLEVPELGAVRWGRDLDAALVESSRSGRPVFLLFQEIPGCGTCVAFGETALSHPLLGEAIETLFVPVAVRNNIAGREAAVCERFGEPSWNFPVVRFLDASGRDILPRADGIWTTGGVLERAVAALEAAERIVPDWLRLVRDEHAEGLARATFGMHCFWEGEAQLGRLDGVLTTLATWSGGGEAVGVVFDPAAVPWEGLAEEAAEAGCDALHAPGALRDASRDREARESDRKFHLRKTPYSQLSLTPAQATKVNAAVRFGEDPARWLSPRQRTLLVAEG